MKPVVDRLKQEFKGKVEFRRLDVTSDPEAQRIADAVQAQYVPTFLFLDKAGKKVDMLVGGASEEQLRVKIAALTK